MLLKIEEKMHLEELVIKVKYGNDKAKEEILEILSKAIKYYAAKFFIKGYDLEDLISEGYNSVLHAINKYKTEYNCFYTYACRSIENNYKYLLRQRKEPENRESISLTDELSDTLNSKEIAVEDAVLINILKKAIETLPEEEKEVIKEIYIKDNTISDVARQKGLSFGRVQYLRNRGISNLKGVV